MDWDGVCVGGDCVVCAVEECLMGDDVGSLGVGWGLFV